MILLLWPWLAVLATLFDFWFDCWFDFWCDRGFDRWSDHWHEYWSVSRSSSGPSAPAPARADPRRPLSADSLFRDRYGDSDDEDEDDEEGYADPVQDDLYSRKVGLAGQPAGAAPYDKFLPKFWTPEEEVHIQKIKMGSQRRPWYRKMQGFRCVRAPPSGRAAGEPQHAASL